MDDLARGVAEVASVLESLSLPYMLVGGLAVAVWGEPRSTLDSDWTVWTEPEDLEPTVLALSERLKVLVRDPIEFVRSTRVLPVATSSGSRADIVFALLPWEKQAVMRAVRKELAGQEIRVAALEDLILMKIISDRKKDLDDCRRLLFRYRGSLDLVYLRQHVRDLSESMGRSDIWDLFMEETEAQ